MAVLDFREEPELLIRAVTNRPFSFELVAYEGAPSYIGATITLVIATKPVRSYSVGNGLTIKSATTLFVAIPGIPQGIYNYAFTITPLTGEVTIINDKIHVSNAK